MSFDKGMQACNHNPDQDKKDLPRQKVPPFLLFILLFQKQPLFTFLSPYIFPCFTEHPVNGITQYCILLCLLLLSPNKY